MTIVTKSDSILDIEREVRALVHRVRRTSMDNAQLIHPELPISAYAVLLFILDNGPIRAQEIVDSLGVDKATISRQIAQLEEIELVTRSCDPLDRRAQTVALTADGQARIDAVGRQRRSEFMSRLTGWSAADLAQLAANLDRYNSSLSD